MPEHFSVPSSVISFKQESAIGDKKTYILFETTSWKKRRKSISPKRGRATSSFLQSPNRIKRRAWTNLRHRRYKITLEGEK